MDQDAFDRLVARLDPAMVVVTTVADDGERSGCLVGFHSQISIDPLRYGVWISTANHTHGVVRRASHLALHAVTVSDEALAVAFGTRSGDDVDKFADVAWRTGPGGVPLLEGVDAWLVARIVDVVDTGGDHALVVGEPVEASAPPSEQTGPGPLRLESVIDLPPGHPADDGS